MKIIVFSSLPYGVYNAVFLDFSADKVAFRDERREDAAATQPRHRGEGNRDGRNQGSCTETG